MPGWADHLASVGGCLKSFSDRIYRIYTDISLFFVFIRGYSAALGIDYTRFRGHKLSIDY